MLTVYSDHTLVPPGRHIIKDNQGTVWRYLWNRDGFCADWGSTLLLEAAHKFGYRIEPELSDAEGRYRLSKVEVRGVRTYPCEREGISAALNICIGDTMVPDTLLCSNKDLLLLLTLPAGEALIEYAPYCVSDFPISIKLVTLAGTYSCATYREFLSHYAPERQLGYFYEDLDGLYEDSSLPISLLYNGTDGIALMSRASENLNIEIGRVLERVPQSGWYKACRLFGYDELGMGTSAQARETARIFRLYNTIIILKEADAIIKTPVMLDRLIQRGNYIVAVSRRHDLYRAKREDTALVSGSDPQKLRLNFLKNKAPLRDEEATELGKVFTFVRDTGLGPDGKELEKDGKETLESVFVYTYGHGKYWDRHPYFKRDGCPEHFADWEQRAEPVRLSMYLLKNKRYRKNRKKVDDFDGVIPVMELDKGRALVFYFGREYQKYRLEETSVLDCVHLVGECMEVALEDARFIYTGTRLTEAAKSLQIRGVTNHGNAQYKLLEHRIGRLKPVVQSYHISRKDNQLVDEYRRCCYTPYKIDQYGNITGLKIYGENRLIFISESDAPTVSSIGTLVYDGGLAQGCRASHDIKGCLRKEIGIVFDSLRQCCGIFRRSVLVKETVYGIIFQSTLDELEELDYAHLGSDLAGLPVLLMDEVLQDYGRFLRIFMERKAAYHRPAFLLQLHRDDLHDLRSYLVCISANMDPDDDRIFANGVWCREFMQDNIDPSMKPSFDKFKRTGSFSGAPY